MVQSPASIAPSQFKLLDSQGNNLWTAKSLMVRRWKFFFVPCSLILLLGSFMRMQAEPRPNTPLQKPDEEWRKTLSPEQYRLLRQSGTERAGTGEYLKHDQQ